MLKIDFVVTLDDGSTPGSPTPIVTKESNTLLITIDNISVPPPKDRGIPQKLERIVEI